MTLDQIPLEYWIPDRDVYRLPNGRTIDGWRVRQAKREADFWREAAMAYDPYNHKGRRVK